MPEYIGEPMRTYMDDAASGAPTPGGGSVSSLAASLGTTMASMAANFTVGKKKFADVEEEVKGLLDALAAERAELLRQMQSDTEAYAEVGAAYGMPKKTDEEKSARREAIQGALLTAMGPPLETLRSCRRASKAVRRLADVANPNLITDVGVAAILLEASAVGAALNVKINLASMKDKATVDSVSIEVVEALEEISRLCRETVAAVAKTFE